MNATTRGKAIATYCRQCIHDPAAFGTARSRTSGEYLFCVFMLPSSQRLESPEKSGRFNLTYDGWSSVSGGQSNNANGLYSSISGGQSGLTQGNVNSINGGKDNTASGSFSTVSGGNAGSVTGDHDWRAGSLFEDY